METIQPGKYVEMVYDLYVIDPNGSEKLVHQVEPSDPEKIVYGVTQGMIIPLEKAILGLKPGDAFDVKVNCNEGFGPHDKEQIVRLEKELFEVDGKFDAEFIKKGAHLPMMTADGYRITGLVIEVTEIEVVMDFNHPLAGKDIRFKGNVGVVRDATPEELQPVHSCGCGCGDHDCGDHDCGGCHDGCCH
ncbi:MAG: FKBP-type peptidyl-prolyl cis-trans isomerase [Muribaculaceae bacterium]|nr:FKBP-type peptidyl-prolyl cis-trans isomerase [Muribaculaceae bacterium]